ncbi:MAG: GNAT family N-acetyltransferase [Chloroflexota bacterium]
MTISIRPIQVGESLIAKRLVVEVAQPMYAPDLTPAEFLARLDAESFFYDIDTFQTVYAPPDGLFLVVVDGDELIGTGAIRRRDETTAELKRLYLRTTYHGQGIGYRVASQLLAFARQQGYEAVRLSTGHVQQRAIHFYSRLGFVMLDELDEREDLQMLLRL